MAAWLIRIAAAIADNLKIFLVVFMFFSLVQVLVLPAKGADTVQAIAFALLVSTIPYC
jgi:hypothetical protein